MNTLKIFFALLLILGVLYILRNIASYLLYEWETADYLSQKENDGFPTSEKFEDYDAVKVIEKNKFVKETNIKRSKTFTPKDANRVQNLNKRYNVGTYRGSDGRYKSLKDV